MKEILLTQITTDDISSIVRDELQKFFADKHETAQSDELGGIELAIKITGLAKSTIYCLCSSREIPHSKRGKLLYFSRNELNEWLKSGKRKTQAEISIEAGNFGKNK
jgi:excisionase family DNA binding protein